MDNKAELTQTATRMLTEYLTGKKMRKTPERYEVLKVVCQMPGIFSIDQLSSQMEKSAAFTVSRATLFNTLETFLSAQIVVKHTLARAAHYECNVHPAPQVCTVCRCCGSVKKLDDAQLSTWLTTVKVRQFYIHQPVLYLHGLCRKCNTMLNKRNKSKKNNTKQKEKA